MIQLNNNNNNNNNYSSIVMHLLFACNTREDSLRRSGLLMCTKKFKMKSHLSLPRSDSVVVVGALVALLLVVLSSVVTMPPLNNRMRVTDIHA